MDAEIRQDLHVLINPDDIISWDMPDRPSRNPNRLLTAIDHRQRLVRPRTSAQASIRISHQDLQVVRSGKSRNPPPALLTNHTTGTLVRLHHVDNSLSVVHLTCVSETTISRAPPAKNANQLKAPEDGASLDARRCRPARKDQVLQSIEHDSDVGEITLFCASN